MTKSAVVLLVEDDQSLLDGIADLLEMADTGYEIRVLTAANGVQGLEVLSKQIPDLVISDIMMPRMGGIEFLGKLRENSEWVHIPVVFLSARGARQDVLEGRLSGAEHYITKPFDNDEFLKLVKVQLNRTFELQDDRRRRVDGLRSNIIQLLNHEFRTPLTYVTAYYEMLAESLSHEDAHNLQEYLKGIQTGAIRLSTLVEDLIRVVELRTGETATHFKARSQPISDMSQLLKGVLSKWREQEYSKKVLFHDLVPDDLPTVHGDREGLIEILDRVIDNAVKFSICKRDNQPEVWLQAGTRNGRLQFSVKDNGIGLPEHASHQIFDMFYQHNRAEMEQQGSGAGLAIVKGLVDLHGGTVGLESQLDIGTTLTVSLPILKTDLVPISSAEPLTRHKRLATVLIVEDEWYLMEGLRELIEIFECEYEIRVLTANNGREGLEVLHSYQPDLIISDIMMPYLDGYEFLEKVRQNPAWLHIPFIFLTAKGERRDILRGRSSGAEQYITKPYDSDELLDLVVTQLNRYFQMQSVVRQSTEELRRGILELLQPEFRLPLNSVTDFSQKLAVALDGVESEEDLKNSLLGIKAASNRISRLVEDFIFLAELRSGEVSSSFQWRAQPLEVNVLLIDISRSLTQSRLELSRTVERSLASGLPTALFDYDLLRKGFLRLFESSATLAGIEEPTCYSIISEQSGQEIVVRAGVLEGNVERGIVTEINDLLAVADLPVMRLSNFDSGLAIMKGIIDLHGGRVGIWESEKGCLFSVRLPTYQPDV